MQGYFDLVKKLQPKANIFQDGGTIRWCGNEAGKAPFAQWAVVPMELCPYNEPQTNGALMEGSLEFSYNTDLTIGSIQQIMYSKGLVFAPAETDMSIRPGWFYHKDEEPHSLERLFKTYINTVGNNSTFNLNIPPMPNGKFDPRDLERLKELGNMLRTEFSQNLADGIEFETLSGYGETQPEYTLKLNKKETIKYIELAERISEGQRIESFSVFIKDDNGLYKQVAQGTTIGSRKILKIEECETDVIKIRITSSRDVPDIEWIKVY